MRHKAKAHLDYTRAGPMKWLVAVVEHDKSGGWYSCVFVAEYAEADKKKAQRHVKKVQAAIDWRPS